MCPFCSAFNDHDAHYCKKCGTQLSTGHRDLFAEPVRNEDVSDTGYLWMALLALIGTFLYGLVFPLFLRHMGGTSSTLIFYRSMNLIFLVAEFWLLIYFTRNSSRRTAIICIGSILLLFQLVSVFGFLNF